MHSDTGVSCLENVLHGTTAVPRFWKQVFAGDMSSCVNVFLSHMDVSLMVWCLPSSDPVTCSQPDLSWAARVDE